ncbi:DUF418 domain-containing protein [Kocuria sp. SM24M-10]|uniref:DUF418 domain-containing protein n=1 Tax=Kocuria sp. SM24M-10 TaxID=1660349 RepID=UPI00064B37CB|nr:DUF418 domain-containing protein [Kocuria sp. SM24M-10]KLU09092.1 hypothetical protein ABL57_14210 [Kocuria sp. SM24M-10]
MSAPRTAPAAARVPAPDVARGLMLWVIAVANVTAWIWAPGPTDGPRDRTLGAGAGTAGWTADDVVNTALSMLVDGRGFPLFSFLVGYGVGQIAAREAARGTPLPAARRLLLRRYGWLLLVGALHACLLFPGDIITAYAFGGLFLTLLIAEGTATLLVLAGLGSVLMVLYGAASWAVRTPGTAPFPSLVTDSAQEHLALVLAEGAGVVAFAPLQLLGLLPMLLLGLALSRYRVLEDPGPRRGRLLVTAAVCIGAGLLTGVGTGLLTTDMLEPSTTAGSVLTGLDALTGAAQGIGYALVVALVCARAQRRSPGAPLRAREHPALWALQALGRRSMSGYIAQSVLFTVLMPPFALGLGRALTPTAALLLGTTVWLVTLLGAVLLERRGLRGPVETVHRRLFLGPARDRSGPHPAASA